MVTKIQAVLFALVIGHEVIRAPKAIGLVSTTIDINKVKNTRAHGFVAVEGPLLSVLADEASRNSLFKCQQEATYDPKAEPTPHPNVRN